MWYDKSFIDLYLELLVNDRNHCDCICGMIQPYMDLYLELFELYSNYCISVCGLISLLLTYTLKYW